MSTESLPTLPTLAPPVNLQRHLSDTATLHRPSSPTRETADYENPLTKSSRWALSAKALALRSGAYLGFSISHYSDSDAPSPTGTIYLDSTLSQWKGKKVIAVDVFDPHPTADQRHKRRRNGAKRPAVINFHGGGFVLGTGTDDRRWIGSVHSELDAVVFSVNYRLAPSYPFPTAVEDCADAILQIYTRSAEYDFDSVLLSGFSAGGTLSLASWVVLQDPARWGYKLPAPVPDITGMVIFYPGLDWSIPRPQKRETCSRPDLTLPPSLTDLIDASYIYPHRGMKEREDLRLSPGLMPDSLVDLLPPIHLCLCEHDMLLAEAMRFANRVCVRGRSISARTVPEEKHAWDKPLPMTPKPSVVVEYSAATARVKGWLSGDEEAISLEVESIVKPEPASVR